MYRETWSERLARWTRRHRTWFQAAILSLAVIAVVSATAAVLVLRAWQREATAWGEAEGRFVQAREAVDKWLTGVSEALRYYPLLARTREALLERAAEDYERFVQQTGNDGELTLERGPHVSAVRPSPPHAAPRAAGPPESYHQSAEPIGRFV